MKRLIAFASLFVLSASTLAAFPPIPREDLFRLGFTPPELIRSHLDDLHLDAGQRDRLTTLFEAAKTATPALETAVQEQGQALETAVQAVPPNVGEAEATLNRLLDAEAALKRLQLRTILEINNLLTPEQRAKALELAKKDLEMEAEVHSRAQRLRTALESLGIKPTQAIQDRGNLIKQLMDSGKFGPALEALDAAIKDTGLDETATEESLDFSQFEPGITELSTLQQRYQDVERRTQQVIRFPLLRQLVQAQAELEAAKTSQDAIAVGRILTWAEGALP